MPNAAQRVPRSMLLISAVCSMTWSVANSDAVAMGRVPDVPAVISRCPPLKSYNPATTAQAAGELRELLGRNPAAAVPKMIRDYRAHRDACRAIEAK
jgi:hypothetical protein